MKVVLSAETGQQGRAAQAWCTEHLGPGDSVVAVVGLSNLGELVLGVPPFDGLATEGELIAEVEYDFCRQLRTSGVLCQTRFVRRAQARAVAEVASEEDADLIVIGKRPHSRLADAVIGPVAAHVVHRPPCPVVVVPASA
ncbi:MAG TPA: universal stress protein [Acidimicrobiales bacterium]|nr:universal stress protein [Acidimicrobiales bacterium]